MTTATIGLVWRGERGAAMSPRAEAMLGPLFSAFAELDVTAVPVVYDDGAAEDVRAELHALDGAIVWVNPIQDGATRAQLDELLREAVDAGVWVSARPDVIDTMGTKEVLYATRGLGWGTDVACYRSPAELARQLPSRLARHGRLVVKQARGTGGNGVWRVELPPGSAGCIPDAADTVLVQRADPRQVTPIQPVTLAAFLADCGGCFSWSGCLVDQPYQPRLADGMVRVYFVHDEVIGFCHQWPRALLPPTGADGTPESPVRPAMEDADTAEYAALRRKAEREWVPDMKRVLGLSAHDLPVLWDADFLYGPKTGDGDDTFVLCEINVQAVWPYPTQGNDRLARAAVDQVLAAKAGRGRTNRG